jgi:hypothetical protein
MFLLFLFLLGEARPRVVDGVAGDDAAIAGLDDAAGWMGWGAELVWLC